MDVRKKASSKKRLIDAKEGKKVFSAIAQTAEYKGVLHMVVPISEIDKLPTVDAVEVVRCRECKHCDPENYHCDHPMSTAAPLSRKPDDFCSYGERKEGAD